MKHLKRFSFPCTLIIALAFLLPGTGIASAAAVSSCGQWKITPSPNPGSHGDVLRGIANVPGSTSLWTVGNYYPTQGVQNSNTLTIFHC